MHRLHFILGLWLLLCCSDTSRAEDTGLEKADHENASQWVQTTVNGYLIKAHYLPAKQPDLPSPAVLLVAGSGATDHNGNNLAMGLHNNSYQMLAAALQQAGYAVLRPDKRGVGQSRATDHDPAAVRFDHHVKDVVAWIQFLRQHHTDITVIGHSLGGLMAMQAMRQEPVNRLVALASVADSAHATVKRQMQNQPEFVRQAALPLLDRLAQGETIPGSEVPVFLHPLLGPDTQGYLQSFMQLEPRSALQDLYIPTLVLVGDHDIQIAVPETQQMAAGLPHVRLQVIAGMNHVLKAAPAERMANMATYAEPERPLHADLMPALLAFLPTVHDNHAPSPPSP
ncbi:alpha/beta hydrolase [Marinicella meishanensis]|uniref:alpha/beta hydrolase n=1 Tax=Marinicella meishanensis TaxID=2873263 RepID=UPI001CBEC8AC|nr:alpha/beta fold hydrolase [Marinicella sp. NBU2979]